MSAYPRELEVSYRAPGANVSRRGHSSDSFHPAAGSECHYRTHQSNIPARIALKVSSQIDSRTILDAGGAEKLLGAGDMLYSSGDAQPERLQSAFISEGEVKKV